MGRFPFPIPDGWFGVAWSNEVAVGDVRPLRVFGEERVLFRDEGGVARVFDAHCPHLGAHLGHGGRVVGDGLRCPFHGWRFDGSGACVGIDYARKIPKKARVAAWRVQEKGGLVLVWHHARGEPPAWDVPDLPEFDSEEWTPPERREWQVASHAQEMAENTVDNAHFRTVHGTNDVPETESAEIDGHVFRVISRNRVQTPRGEQRGRIEIQAHGLGYGITRFSGIADLMLLIASAPVDAEHVHMRLQFSVRKLADSDATRGVGKAFIAEIERQFGQDIPLWEHKAYWERPLLCDGDGPIGLLRRWARQFYTG